MKELFADEGVSPVVGVMLMLVVTIIIAAVVSAFAGGFSDGTEKTPQISVGFTYDLTNNVTYFENKGGESVLLSDIKVRFKSGSTTTTLQHSDVGNLCYAFEVTDGTDVFSPGSKILLAGTGHNTAGTGIKFGKGSLSKGSKIEWALISTESGNTIASGSEVLL